MRLFRALLAVLLAVPAGALAPVRLLAPTSSGPAALNPAALSVPVLSAPSSLLLPSSSAGLVPTLQSALTPALKPAPSATVLPANDDVKPERLDVFFDGAAKPQDDEPISPRLILPGGSENRIPLRAAVVRGAVERALPALRESVALGSWNGPDTTLDESCCGDAAPKLAAILRARGVPARLVEAEFHYYVSIEMPDGQIIVDPTIRQFFGKKKAPNTVPLVFVGTVSELNDLFERHAHAKWSRYDVSRIYFSGSVTRESQLNKVESDIKTNGARDLAPLRRYLGLPFVPPPAPEPPKLYVP